MWRYIVGAIGALMMVSAGLVLYTAHGRADQILPPPPRTAAAPAIRGGDPLPDTVPEASERTREQKRFDRYDKDRDGRVTRDEYLASRRKAFAKLDANGDGRLSFDEWAVKTTDRFAAADRDRSGALTEMEFATTRPKRAAPRPRCACPPAKVADDE